MSAVIIRETGESITLDATFQVSVDDLATVTEHPIEVGSSSADHSQPRQARVQIQGKITETPFAIAGREVSFEGNDNRFREVRAFLNSVREAGERVTVVTPKHGVFENMAIASVRSVSTNVNATPLTIDLQQVRLAERITVQIPPLRPREDAAPGLPDEQDTGQQPTTNPLSESNAERSSILFGLGQTFGWLE